MTSQFQNFIGKNYFKQDTNDDLRKAALHARVSINLKVKGDVIEGTDIPFPDFQDIDVESSRLTVTIDPSGIILSLKRG